MRMWMLPPERLCRKHLLGEHVETHMFLGSLLKGKPLTGFFDRRLLEPELLFARHNVLAEEMLRRGYAHKSPMEPAEVAAGLSRLSPAQRYVRVDRELSRAALSTRCEGCKALLEGFRK